MPKFQYKAKNMQGKLIEGLYDAPNQTAVIEMIRQKNYFHLEVKEIIERKDLSESGFKKRIGKKDIAIFCRQFASILKAGVPLVQCIVMLSEQTSNKVLKSVLISVNEDIQKGSTLSQALMRHEEKFPPLLLNMIEAGEVSGTIDDTLELMATHFEKDYKLQQKVKGAMVYPIAVMIVAVVVIVFMLIAVVPMFVGMFESSGAELPGPTKALISMSNFIKTRWYVIIAVIALIMTSVKVYMSKEENKINFDKMLLKMPLIGDLQTNIIAARFSRTMSSLMATGVSITESIEITGKVLGNTYAREGMKEVEESVKQGKGLYGPIKSLEIFPSMIDNMVMLGEQSGTIVQMLDKSAIFYEEEVDGSVDKLTAMMEPMIIVVLGGAVAFIVVAMMSPMFDMMNLVQGM